MRSEQEANRAVERYADMVRRLCLVHLKNEADTEDVFQTVFLQYVLHDGAFESEEHEKAWLLRVTINACRDVLRSLFRARRAPEEELERLPADTGEERREVLAAVLSLPEKYRDAVYLLYYEGYRAPEIAKLLGKNVNTVYTLLTRARERLRELLGGEGDG